MKFTKSQKKLLRDLVKDPDEFFEVLRTDNPQTIKSLVKRGVIVEEHTVYGHLIKLNVSLNEEDLSDE